jgi:hypothetical protein
MVRSQTNDAGMDALISELKILIYLGSHMNVVNLLGACTKQITKGTCNSYDIRKILLTAESVQIILHRGVVRYSGILPVRQPAKFFNQPPEQVRQSAG